MTLVEAAWATLAAGSGGTCGATAATLGRTSDVLASDAALTLTGPLQRCQAQEGIAFVMTRDRSKEDNEFEDKTDVYLAIKIPGYAREREWIIRRPSPVTRISA
jgi:hypothetical protein